MFIIISGSAGVGKNTIITKILESNNKIKLMQTCTTRQRRSTDSEMHNPYIYLTKEDFEQKILNGEFFEHEEIHGNIYGILNASLDVVRQKQKHFIKDIGVLGQLSVKRALKKDVEVVSIFLTAPKEVLIKRLKKRGDHDIDIRISRMEFELGYNKNYDYVIENLTLSRTLRKIQSIIKKHEKLEIKKELLKEKAKLKPKKQLKPKPKGAIKLKKSAQKK